MSNEEKLVLLQEHGYKLQERIQYVSQFFDLPMTVETLLSDDGDVSGDLVETYYDNSESDYLLVNKDDEPIVSGSLSKILTYIEQLTDIN